MKNIKLISLLLLFILPQFVFPNAGSKAIIQNLRVKNINDSILIISYDIVKSKRNESFDVTLEAKFQAGKNIDIQTFSGDVGKTKAGISKTIKWNISKDIYNFNGFLNIKLKAKSSLGKFLSTNSKLVRVQIEKEYIELENQDPNNKLLADIQWIVPETRSLTVTEKEFSIHVCVSSKIKIQGIYIFINNDLVISDRGFKPISGNCPNTVKKDFDLVEGLNEIRLEIIDKQGNKTESFLLVKKE